ncbi:hypothetical protein [Nocardiopsis sp. NRRL B-16309]|uniref:hypothetical protein n=1 Tax=Nocardiopsis sp. NRRL B-16309 TaxID=1519494 RepID=UPI0006AF0659|nr:hypothetical protein [Nocardiopsis sp. NRRL B-16309]KOX10117.1 hypothetical protein ADL05_25895 [Nocardiopsis sp. NRRL B-16309]
MNDLPRDPGTLYAVKSNVTGRHITLPDYGAAYEHWHAGRVVYTKNGNGTRAERNARTWQPVDPPA